MVLLIRVSSPASGRVLSTSRCSSQPRLADAEAQIGEIEAAVRVRIDADQHAFILRHLALRVKQIEAFRMRVEFEEAAAVFRLPDDAQHVHVIRRALLDQPPVG